MNTLDKEIRQLFADARSTDEFKLVLTLINYHGLGTHKLTSNLYEWFEAMEYYIDLHTKETDTKKKVRTGLLLYSIFQENSDFYNIIGSLCNTILGLQPSSYLYWKTKKYDRFLGVAEKQNFILEKLDECGFDEIVKFFKEQIHTSIRNNYFHSTYALSDTEFILHDSEPVMVAGFSKKSLNINAELMPYIESVICFFSVFRDCFFSNFESYKENAQVIGYFPNKCDITILGNQAGLL